MCGIAGFWGTQGGPSPVAIVTAMTDAIAHRGPDAAGAWTDPEAGIMLGHRRLSILDLSPAGEQPMTSASGRYVLVFNGEIYNFEELRHELDAGGAHTWRGHSDTEVILAALERWGPDATWPRLNGMWAIALWDRETRSLTLSRDRLGEKPLYFGRSNGVFLFGSELKALVAHPSFTPAIDRTALTLMLRYNHVPEPRSIYRDIAKLTPGTSVQVSDGGRTIGAPVAYWSFADVAAAAARDPLPVGEATTDALETLLKNVIRQRMVADVPLGAFLSGGIDSSLIVALMQAQSLRAVKTFTIGFEEQGHDEAVHARAVARHLNTDHTEWYVTPRDAADVIPQLPTMYDEPFGDSSQIPTHLVSQLARREVTVALSGDAGDELFGGYNRYTSGMGLFRFGSRLPAPIRRAAGALFRARGTLALAEAAMRPMPVRWQVLGLSGRLPKIGASLTANDVAGLYRQLTSNLDDPARFVVGGDDPDIAVPLPNFADPREEMMARDTLGYLPGDILAKVDRASMATSLETRVPFLDPRVVEFAWRVPMTAKVRDGRGKLILRDILYRHVPRGLIERPKTGFGIPLGDWLRGTLRDWAEDLLDPRSLRDDGFLAVDPVRALWEAHLAGGQHQAALWNILMFQAWRCAARDGAGLRVTA